jgi:hypothetical protein
MNLVWLQNIGVGVICSLAGALFLVPGFLVFRNSCLKMRTWRTASGTVIGYQEIQPGRHLDSAEKIDTHFVSRTKTESITRTAYNPRVQFTVADGKAITFTSLIGSSSKSYPIGAKVSVLHDSQNPENAVIKSFSKLFLMPILFTILGGTLFGVALRPLLFSGHR